eukprot:CAMPEP_0184871626 /NCGR_PEP_ID=MMETSP0580-20130426/40826_1 /TAXON_ID=1118495 /ORGANISM="Dactyliosolen fragilissimus" /LENGTH=233 /DNA_ID=CAMNT_0027374313 /DNA_START=79 /DNA_END=781 /DNA_ORIENTATION=+
MRAPASMRGRMQGRGGRLGGRSGGGRGRSGGSGRFQRDEGPPDEVVEVGHFMHECENEMVYKLIEKDGKVPYFNAGVYLQNKKKLGKVDEIFGPINEVMFTVKPDNGIIAKSFVKDDAVYIGTDKLLPMERFTNPGKPEGEVVVEEVDVDLAGLLDEVVLVEEEVEEVLALDEVEVEEVLALDEVEGEEGLALDEVEGEEVLALDGVVVEGEEDMEEAGSKAKNHNYKISAFV